MKQCGLSRGQFRREGETHAIKPCRWFPRREGDVIAAGHRSEVANRHGMSDDSPQWIGGTDFLHANEGPFQTVPNRRENGWRSASETFARLMSGTQRLTR